MLKKIITSNSVFDLPFEIVRKVYLSHAIFVSLLLVLFTPFQLHRSSAMDLLAVCLVTGLGLFVAGSVSFHLIHGYVQKHNIRRKYFIFAEFVMAVVVILMVTSLTFLSRSALGKVPMTWPMLGLFLQYSVVIAPFLVIIMRTVIIIRELLFMVNATAEDRNPVSHTRDIVIELADTVEHDNMQFSLHQFLYANADGNYVELHLLVDGVIKTLLLRYTLKSLMQCLDKHPSCVQCHRSYVVNMQNVAKINRDKSTMKLTLVNDLASIPVSRGHSKAIADY